MYSLANYFNVSETEHFKRIVNTLKFVYVSSSLIPKNESFNINSLFILNELEKCFEYLQTDPSEFDWNLIANNTSGDKSTSPFKNFIYSPVKVCSNCRLVHEDISDTDLTSFFARNKPMWILEATCSTKTLFIYVSLIWTSFQAC